MKDQGQKAPSVSPFSRQSAGALPGAATPNGAQNAQQSLAHQQVMNTGGYGAADPAMSGALGGLRGAMTPTTGGEQVVNAPPSVAPTLGGAPVPAPAGSMQKMAGASTPEPATQGPMAAPPGAIAPPNEPGAQPNNAMLDAYRLSGMPGAPVAGDNTTVDSYGRRNVTQYQTRPAAEAAAQAPAQQPGTLSNEWGTVTTQIDPFGRIQENAPNAGPLQHAIDGGGDIQQRLDNANLPALVGGDALAGQMTAAQQAAYQNATGYLDPQWQNEQSALETKLANQGVMQNSEAWNKAMDNFQRQKQFAYQQAQSNAYQQGLAAQGQLFNQGLAANQNQFGQNLQSGQFANSAQAQELARALTQGSFANAAQGQQFNQGLAGMQAANAAQQQGFNQNLARSTFANAGQAQIAGQGLQNRGFEAQIQAAREGAAGTVAAANASAGASMSNMAAQLAAQGDQNRFLNSMTMRNQGINEMLLQQQNPLNMANSLGGGTVGQPQFTNAPGTGLNPADLMSAFQNQYGGQLNSYNANVGAANSGNAAMASIIAAFLCDPRLKKNIRQIGVHRIGVPLYEFDYLWGEHGVGVMADELEAVLPAAVHRLPNGYKFVDYARL